MERTLTKFEKQFLSDIDSIEKELNKNIKENGQVALVVLFLVVLLVVVYKANERMQPSDTELRRRYAIYQRRRN